MEKMPKLCCPFLCKLTTQSIETYGKINLVGMCSHPIILMPTDCDVNQKSEPIWVLLIQCGLVNPIPYYMYEHPFY